MGAEQPDLANVLQEQLQRVGRHVYLRVERELGLAAPALVRASLNLVGDGRGRVDVLDQLDLRSLQKAVQLFDVGVINVKPGRCRRDLSVGEHADPLALGNQALYLFEFLQFDYCHLIPFSLGTGSRVPPYGPAPVSRAVPRGTRSGDRPERPGLRSRWQPLVGHSGVVGRRLPALSSRLMFVIVRSLPSLAWIRTKGRGLDPASD